MENLNKINLFSKRHLGSSEADINYMLQEVGYDSMSSFIDSVVPGSILKRNAVQIGDITADKLATSLDLTTKTLTLNIEQISNVSTTAASPGQVLKWSGSEWAPGTDLTASAGSGIGLTAVSYTHLTLPTSDLV